MNNPEPSSVGLRARRKAYIHVVIPLFITSVIAYLDRINLSYAALIMNAQLGFDARVFGLGAGIFFAGRLEALKLLQLTKPGFVETEAGNGAYIELKNGSTAGTKKAIWQTWYRYHVALACTDPGQWGYITGGADD